MRTLIVIPAFNESKNLESLIDDISSYDYDYLIINDNSTDNTKELCKENDFNVLNLPVNLGLAGVTRVGFMYARDNNYDCVVCVDGDGQHQPKYVHTLIKEIENGNDYVVGSRFVDEKKPITMRMLGSRIFCFLIKLKTGKTVSDPTSGMRALSKNVIKCFADDMNFYAEPDTLCFLIRRGFKVKEVQVEMLDRQNGASYFVNPFKVIKFMIGVSLSIIFTR